MGRSIRFDLVTDARGYGRGLREAERFNKRFTGSFAIMQRLASKGVKVNADTSKAESNFSKLGKAVKKFNTTALSVRNLWSLLKFPTIIAGGNALAGVFVALSAEAIGLVSALSPLVGLIPALGVGALAAGQGFAVVKLAFTGIGPALKAAGTNSKKFAAEMKKLPPAQQAVVRALVPFKRELIALRGVAAKNLLPGVSAGLKLATPLLSVFRPIIASTARELGGLAKQGGALLGSGPFRKDFRRIGAGNVAILHEMGKGVLALINVFRIIAVTAQPLALAITQMLRGWAEGLAQFFAQARSSGALTAFFKRTMFTLSLLVDMIGRFSHALGPIFGAALPTGTRFLVMLRNGAAAFDRFTHSARGAAAIKSVFASAQPVLAAIGRLIVAIAKNFAFLGSSINGSKLAGLIDMISAKGVPALAALARNTGGAFLKNLISLVINLTRIFAVIGGNSGVLTGFVANLANISGAVATLLEHNKGIGSFATSVLALGGIASTTGIGSLAGAFFKLGSQASLVKAVRANTALLSQSITGMAPKASLLSRVGGAFKGLAASAGSATLSMVKAVGRQIAAWALLAARAIASAVRIAAAWLISLGPIGLVIAAVAAVAIGLFVLWKKSETFRTIVTASFRAVAGAAMATWNWIRRNWPLLAAIIFGPIAVAAVLVIRNWGRIKAAGAAVWNWIRSNWPRLLGIITGPIGAATIFVVRNWNRIWTTGRDAWNRIKGVVVGSINAFKRVAVDAFSLIVRAFLNLAGAIINGAARAFGWIPGLGGKLKGAAASFNRFRDGVNEIGRAHV